MQNLPRILVGCPTSDYKSYCLREYVDAVKALTYKNYEVLIVDNSKSRAYSKKIMSLGLSIIKDVYTENAKARIVSSRNILREEAIKGYDYFLSLEQDVIPPKDIIERLLGHHKNIATGLYFTYGSDKTLMPLLWVSDNSGLRRLSEEESMFGKVIEVEAAGLGCMLIPKAVLEKVKFRYEKESASFDDMWFCKDIHDQSYRIIADTSVICKHLVEKWDWSKIKK